MGWYSSLRVVLSGEPNENFQPILYSCSSNNLLILEIQPITSRHYIIMTSLRRATWQWSGGKGYNCESAAPTDARHTPTHHRLFSLHNTERETRPSSSSMFTPRDVNKSTLHFCISAFRPGRGCNPFKFANPISNRKWCAPCMNENGAPFVCIHCMIVYIAWAQPGWRSDEVADVCSRVLRISWCLLDYVNMCFWVVDGWTPPWHQQMVVMSPCDPRHLREPSGALIGWSLWLVTTSGGWWHVFNIT